MLSLLLACSPELVVVSPPPGSSISAPWVPLFVDIGESAVGEQPVVSLDGDPLPQPLGASHVRYERLGQGSEWIGTLDLSTEEPGEHRIRVRFESGTAESVFTFAPAENRIELRVSRPDGDPLWARVMVFDSEGNPVLMTGPNVEETDPRARDHSLHTVLVRQGSGVFWLEDGYYRLVVARGIRDAIQVIDLSVDGDQVIQATLAQEVETTGWSTSELHLHTAWSPDSFAPSEPRFDSLLCSDVQAAALTDHDLVAFPEAALIARYGAGLTVIPGMEVSHSLFDFEEEDWDTIGHFNLIPWEEESPKKHLESSLELVEQHAPARIRQLNHPRGIEFNVEEGPEYGVHAFFSALGTPIGNPLAETTRSTPLVGSGFWEGLDAMEILNRFSWELYRSVRLDWFALWDAGFTVTGTGNSDTHSLEQELIGFPVNLTPCPADDGVDGDCLQSAVSRGAVRVSTGPIPSLRLVQGSGPVGEGEMIRLRTSRPLTAQLRVQAASWVPVDEVRLLVDGAVVQSWELETNREGPLDWNEEVEVELEPGDHYVLLEAGFPILEGSPDDYRERLGDYAWIAPSYVPLGWTNPVRVDGDGDGEWTP
ncbi:MAG: hypothetical protein ACI9VR_001755 [Cognaticolwellia sp.]|jgi:hypothetical protein